MSEKICPIMSRPIIDGTQIDANNIRNTTYYNDVHIVVCKKEKCQCWVDAFQRCGLIGGKQ